MCIFYVFILNMIHDPKLWTPISSIEKHLTTRRKNNQLTIYLV